MKIRVLKSLSTGLILALSCSAFAKVSENTLRELSAKANDIGRIDSGTIAVDLAKARSVQIPGATAEFLAEQQQMRVKLKEEIHTSLIEIQKSESSECFASAAGVIRAAQAAGLSSGLGITDYSTRGLFKMTERESLGSLPSLAGYGELDTIKSAISACSK